MSDILRFSTNKPVEVALRWEDGRQVEGRYGQQVMYTLADQRVMYVPPAVAQQIRELGVRQGEHFEICKAEARQGERRWIEWQVRRLESPQQPASSGNGTAAAARDLSTAQNHGNGSTNGVANGFASHFEASPEGVLLPAPVYCNPPRFSPSPRRGFLKLSSLGEDGCVRAPAALILNSEVDR